MTFLTLIATAVLSLLTPPSAASTTPSTPAGYAQAERALTREGRAAVALLRAGDADALHARFAPQLAEQVPLARLRETLDATLAAGPIGTRRGESVLPVDRGLHAYSADHRWAGRTLDTDLAFDPQGRIASLLFTPRRALPRDPAPRPVRLRLPLEGRWWVFWGGEGDELRNYHAVVGEQRHAIDLLRWERGGTTPGGDGSRNRDYAAWDQRVVAPADGRVVAVTDGVRDNAPRVELVNRSEPAGNHVVLRLGDGVHAFLAHMREGSVAVRRGDRVRAGQLLGRVGNSGNSSEPHLHFHLQDTPDLARGTGIPARFADVLVDGSPRRTAPALQGEFIAPRG